jgi:hypothetical protein
MNEFHEPHAVRPAGRDPLDRLVEAFVELSVPEGPDAGVQLRLVASLAAPPVELAAQSALQIAERSRLSVYLRYAMAAAAGVLVCLTAVLLVKFRRGGIDDVAVPGDSQVAVERAPAAVGSDDLRGMIDDYLRTAPDRSALRAELPAAMIKAILRERSELSKSDGWRRAQERLSVALERPELIGVGVGLLGTLPIATHARF